MCKTAQGVPVSGLTLELRHEELEGSLAEWLAAGLLDPEPGSLLTDSHGRFVIPALPLAAYRWSLAVPSGASLEGTVEVPPAAKALLELVLPE